MKKTVLLFISLYMIISNALCQYSFNMELQSEFSYVNSKIFQISNSYYLVANRSDKQEDVNPEIDYSPIIFKINDNGEVLDSLEWFDNTQNAFFNEIVEIGDNTFGLIGSVEISGQPGYFEIFYFIIDENLEIINEYYFDLETGRIEYTCAFINTLNNVSIASVVEKPNSKAKIFTTDKLLLEITLDGILIYDTVYDHSTQEFVYDFIPYPNTTNYILFCSDGFEKSGEINVLDTNYNIIESYYSNDDATVRSIIQTLDNGFITSAREVDNGKVEWLPSFRKYNEFFEETNYVEFGSADTASWPALYNSISSIDYQNFYGGYTFNIDPYNFYSSSKSYFSVYSIDKNLNLSWNKFYGGDAYYRINDIATASDGGCLLTGYKYKNGSIGPFVASLVLIKTDENGIITSTNEEESIPIKNAIISPNPGKNFLQLHTGIYPAKLQIFNINGQLILEEEIHQNTTTIQTQSLSSGTYVWQLLKDGEVVENDKWVKE